MEMYQKFLKNNEIKSFRKFSVFSLAPPFVLESMYNYMEKVQLKKGNFVYREGDKCKFIYFIKEGEVEVISQSLFV